MADKKDDKKRKPLAGAGGFLLLAGLAICVGVFLFGGARRKQQPDNNRNDTPSRPFVGPDSVDKYCEVLPDESTGACDIVIVDDSKPKSWEIVHENKGKTTHIVINPTKGGWGKLWNKDPAHPARVYSTPADGEEWDIVEYPGVGAERKRRLIRS